LVVVFFALGANLTANQKSGNALPGECNPILEEPRPPTAKASVFKLDLISLVILLAASIKRKKSCFYFERKASLK